MIIFGKSRGRRVGGVRSVAATVFAFAVMAGPVYAQESGDATTTTTGYVFRWINFAIVIGVLGWLFSKAVPALRKRSEGIAQKVAEGTRAREAAETEKRVVQEKLAHLDEDVARLNADAKRAADVESQRLRAMAKTEAEAIERSGQAEIAAAENAARLELKAFASGLAVERAEAMLREQMNAGTEATVFRAFVETLEESRN
jgi:F0F1-type ATP synthase membrane subunit b/b'